MLHARKDYQHIQDPTGKIPELEPVFLLRGQDKTAPNIVREWAAQARVAGCRADIIQAALDQADAMDRWQMTNGSKVPDMPTEKPEK